MICDAQSVFYLKVYPMNKNYETFFGAISQQWPLPHHTTPVTIATNPLLVQTT
jgi:hypothetical protein